MATRRPSVPQAQFTAGIARDKAPGRAGKDSDTDGTTPDPGADKSGKTGKSGAGKGKGGRERQPASGPNSRSHQNGVIHGVDHSPVPARSFSGRLLVLGLAMGAVTLLLAPNVHTFLQQRAEISALQADIAAKEAQQGSLESELARWDDPAYIKQQARDRVSMLMPGETGYWVYGANGVEDVDSPEAAAAAAAAAQTTTAKNATEITIEPWVDSLWSAIKESAKVQAPATPPAPKAPAAPETPAAPAPTG